MADTQTAGYLAQIAKALSHLAEETQKQTEHLSEIRRAVVVIAQNSASKH